MTSISGHSSGVLSICCLQAGNTTNVIPDFAVLKGTIRDFSAPVGETLLRRAKEVLAGVRYAANPPSPDVEFDRPLLCRPLLRLAWTRLLTSMTHTLASSTRTNPLHSSQKFVWLCLERKRCLKTLLPCLGLRYAPHHSPAALPVWKLNVHSYCRTSVILDKKPLAVSFSWVGAHQTVLAPIVTKRTTITTMTSRPLRWGFGSASSKLVSWLLCTLKQPSFQNCPP